MQTLVKTKDVAQRFGVTIYTIRNWVRGGLIPVVRPTKQTLRFNIDAVDEALRKSHLAGGNSRKSGTGRKVTRR